MNRVAHLRYRQVAETPSDILHDLSGRAAVSAVMAELVENFARACALRELIFAYLRAVGPLTKGGRRRAVVDLYLQASQRTERLAARIGTRRRPVPVPSLEEVLG